MLLSDPIPWRVPSLLGVAFSALATGAGAAAAAAQGSNATHAVNATSFYQQPGHVLTIPLKRVNHRGVATPSIARRYFKTEVFGIYGAAYLAELTIGTSQQVIDVLIDTGSFEMWVNPNCSSSNVPEFCEAFGHYDPASSSTSQKVDDARGFEIKYGSGEVTGDYYKDDIYISGAKIAQQQFGVANASEQVWFGIMGLAHGLGNGFIKYPIVIDSLAAQGFTNTKLFSMDLGRQASPGAIVTGEMVFGGVDTNRYASLLKKVPADPNDPHYRISLNSLAHRAPGAAASTALTDSNLPLSVIVDSGTTLSLLPEPVVGKLAAQFPGAEPDGQGGYRVDCAYQARDGSVEFGFLGGDGGPVTISVAYADFVWNSGGDCFLGAWSGDDLGVWILGDSFIRGAYVTFDQTNNALFMANRLSCGDGQSRLVAVPAGPDAAAQIPGACPPVAAGGTAPIGQPPPSSKAGGTGDAVPAPSDPAPPGNGAGYQYPTAMTLTSTITRAVVHTVTACPDSVTDCPLRGKVATRLETRTTTFCSGHDRSATSAPAGAAAARPSETASARPPSYSSAAERPVITIPAAVSEEKAESRKEEEEEEEGYAQVSTTAYATTTVYAVTSCGPGDGPGCAVGMTTTRAITVVKTVRVVPLPTPTTPTAATAGPGRANSTWTGDRGPAVVAVSGAAFSSASHPGAGVILALVCGVILLLL
ncbi:acid protease [Xylaria palmicola]|nr:acid protease [Xylaria palmicola]